MEQQHRSLTRKIFLAVLAAVMCIAALCGGMLSSRNEETMTSEPITADAASSPEIKTVVTVVEFINDLSIPIDNWTFKGTNIPGNKSTLINDSFVSGSEYKGTNKNLSSLTTFYYKANPKNITENTEGRVAKWYWDTQNHTGTSVQGPYKIQTSLYAISVGGQLYLPYGAIALGMPSGGFYMDADMIKIGLGGRVYASDLFRTHGGNPTSTTSVYLPLDSGDWLQWDEQGRAFFFPYNEVIGTRYITVNNGVVSTTKDANDKNIPTQSKTQPIPTDSQSIVKDYLSAEGSAPKSYGIYDGTGNAHCPVEESAFYSVSEPIYMGDGKIGDAGTYTATVTPKENYAWDDSGDVAPKTVTWTVGKAENTVELSQNSAKFEQKDEEVRIPLTLGTLSNLDGATFTYTQDGQPCTDISARIDTDTHDLVLTRLTKDAVNGITVEVTIPESTNFNATTLGPVNVTLEAGEGFYLEGNSSKIYATLDEALAAAEGAEATVHVRGNVTVDATTVLTLPNNLTLKGDADSTLTVTGNTSLFNVDGGKSLTLECLNVEAKGSKSLACVAGGIFTLKNSYISGFTQSAVTVKEGSLNLDNGSFFNNSSKWEGAAIYAEGGKIQINGTQFYGNTANGNGGAIYIKNCTMEFLSGSITFNKAKNGGAVYVAESASLQMLGGDIVQNKAENGGGVYVDNTSKMKLSNVNISLNSASKEGGGVFLSQKGVLRIMRNVQIIDNKGAFTNVGTSIDNLFLSAEKCLILEGDITGSKIGISVNMQDESFIICEMGQYVEFPANYFVSDDMTYKIENKNGNVTLCVA